MNSKRALALSLLSMGTVIWGCDGKSQAAQAGAMKAQATANAILERLKAPINPLPGTGFISPMEEPGAPGIHVTVGGRSKESVKRPVAFVVPGRVSGSDRRHSAFKTVSFVMDLRDVDVAALADIAKRIEASAAGRSAETKTFEAIAERKVWKDVISDLGRNSAPLNEFVSAILLFFADHFSGLGLKKEFRGSWADFDEGAGRRLFLLDPNNANVVTLGAWISVPQGRAYVDLVYFAHWGDLDPAEFPPEATAWGTKGTPR